MCGLVVIVGRRGQPVPEAGLRRATAALEHRGPDDRGEHLHGNVGFGFRRLSIVDLSPAGHQPMNSADGDSTIVFNGEIYNHVELRRELAGLGHVFRSLSDTEVLLAAYREWGESCVDAFNGMFAFMIHDRRNELLFGARDRLGVKPLYLWEDSGWYVLASEPRAIGATGLCSLEPDWTRFADSIRWNLMDHAGGTCFQGIGAIAPGHTVKIDLRGGQIATRRYWSLPLEGSASVARSEAEWIDELGVLATDAVRLRMRSDVPVGFTLSGGIDSSLLICEAARLDTTHGALRAFCYQDAQHDEREPIADTVRQTGARLTAIDEAQLDIAELLPKVIHANGEPVHSTSAVANYALFALARQQGVKVLLGGQGADEVLGGYRSFQWDYWHTLFEDRRWAALFADLRAQVRVHGGSAWRTGLATVARSIRIALSGTSIYQRLRDLRPVPARVSDSHALYTPELLGRAAPPRMEGQDFRLSGSQQRSVVHWPLPMYLRIEDRVSMAHGVEARLPFTDYRLVEHSFRMPDGLKHALGLNKRALRRVAERRVPASVVSRIHKFGFPVGDSIASATRLHELCRSLAGGRRSSERGIYDSIAVTRLLQRSPLASDVDALFQLAQTELWLNGLQPAGGAAP